MALGSKRKKRGKGGIALFIIELAVLALLIAGVYFYAQINSGLHTMTAPVNNEVNAANGGDVDFDEVLVNPEVKTKGETGYRNIALIGIDARESSDYDYSNTDTMIVCSINNSTGDVRMVSIYRDTYLNIDPGNSTYRKANSAYANGSITQFLSMINTNLDLNITDYVAVDFTCMVVLIDDIGGIDIDLKADECVHINNYCIETSAVTGASYEPLPEEAGTYHLNGVQAVSYSRIRFGGGNDMKRTQRQRLVIGKIVDKIKSGGLTSFSAVVNDVFPLCRTNLTNASIIQMGTHMLSGYKISGSQGFPTAYLSSSYINNEYLVPVTLESNVRDLHAFLYPDETYIPSQTVLNYSKEIENNSGLTSADIERAKEAAKIENTGSEADTVGG